MQALRLVHMAVRSADYITKATTLLDLMFCQPLSLGTLWPQIDASRRLAPLSTFWSTVNKTAKS